LYFIIKYNVCYKYIIITTTTAINTCKKLFDFGQRGLISFLTLVTNKGKHSIIYYKKRGAGTRQKNLSSLKIETGLSFQ
jgi:hypothetical protein